MWKGSNTNSHAIFILELYLIKPISNGVSMFDIFERLACKFYSHRRLGKHLCRYKKNKFKSSHTEISVSVIIKESWLKIYYLINNKLDTN